VAITEGGTKEYYKSIEAKISPHFEPFESGFRWRKKPGVEGIALLVDFMAPEVEATPLEDGTLGLEDKIARANVGKLRPFPLRAGRLVDADAMARTINSVDLVYKQGVRADVAIRHAGPVGLLATKADALNQRDEPKDGYDISWWCLNAKPEPREVAELVIERDAFKDPYFQESVALLEKAFKAPDYPGPDGYARVRHPRLDPGDALYGEDRNAAFLAVSELVKFLKPALWA
jgi:hypothetical protein